MNDPNRRAFIAKSYRVLLTRARQGMIVFLPEGSQSDKTRLTSLYDGIFGHLLASGFNILGPDVEQLPCPEARLGILPL